MILARCTGAVTVSSIKTLKNLLGNNPEWLEPAPHVGPVHDGGFVGLEVWLGIFLALKCLKIVLLYYMYIVFHACSV